MSASSVSPDPLILGTVNASVSSEVSAEILVGAVKGVAPADAWKGHLIALFTEVSFDLLDRFLRHHGIRAEEALRCYLRYVRPTDAKPAVEEWLHERRDLEESVAEGLGLP